MRKALYTSFGESSDDREVVKAVAEWITASDLCAKATDEDFSQYWRDCSEAQDRLHRYFSDEAVTSIIINKDGIRQILSENVKDFGTT
jgi:hypothetical protein